ncbi:NEQ421 [Nanoarchaeum equitans Kin4-M]|uniref:NEQ421 n=1 Tax=Nanoarchaeum equitans (strain Kin4-M) TaxID=228908 RepID=Q74N27_NANEQ|nr:NEQ421 [Nanoarchaeum equitans Kin4-M]
MKVLKLEGIRKSYNDLVVLDNINLDIDEGEFVSIMGPSGSGKTTLLNIMGLLDKPDKGKIIIKNKDVTNIYDDNILSYIRGKEIGFVFQHSYLIPVLTALENVLLPSIFIGSPNKDRAKKLLDLVGLKGYYNHYPNQLSGGQQQRVAIARALMNNPSIILADEPTASLDVKTAKTIVNLFKELNDKGHTIVMVTHDPNIAKYSKRIVVLYGGKILSDNASLEEALKLIEQ